MIEVLDIKEWLLANDNNKDAQYKLYKGNQALRYKDSVWFKIGDTVSCKDYTCTIIGFHRECILVFLDYEGRKFTYPINGLIKWH